MKPATALLTNGQAGNTEAEETAKIEKAHSAREEHAVAMHSDGHASAESADFISEGAWPVEELDLQEVEPDLQDAEPRWWAGAELHWSEAGESHLSAG